MAKISARGETEHLRFEASGVIVVLTKKPDLRPGRLLLKLGRASGYTVVRPYGSRVPLAEAAAEATKFAEDRKLVKMPVRR